ncbi:hypothetical protein O3G_MSEX005724 [Manduca sexta]|uniref:Coiled-coil domain-containing protein 149-B n=1 Tax=Manduca sexta TaxID=7130 RepID=A0A921YZQ8_MANSE|nr:hypothetical protein O3G_MSEX005724 [Manduca sexta]
MFNKAPFNKVKFQDQQLDDYLLENSVLKSKLQSKIDALSIMNKELDKCSMERDRYKILVEQLKYKESVSIKRQDSNNGIYKFTPTNTISGGDMLAKTRDQNNMLKLEVEMLQNKLEEATGDITALRKQLHKKEYIDDFNGSKKSSNMFTCSNKDYEQLVQDLEKIKKKYQQIQLDYRATLDEKEELVSDRDYYKNKVQRLNHQISYILTNRGRMIQSDGDVDPPKPIIDIDALTTENKYLHERITQLQVEKEILKQTLNKYKSLLHNRNKSYSWHLKKGISDIMTQKQVKEYLENHAKGGTKQNSASEMKALCLGLFEALNDKSIALQHQRKTNQILANRITELEKTLDSWGNDHKHIQIFPSQILHEFILDSGSVKSEDAKDKSSNESPDTTDNKCKYSDSEDENKDNSGSSDPESCYGNPGNSENRTMGKTILPVELEELVKEALAELKPVE